MSTLLPFHKSILEDIHDPATSDLIVLARGLGLRRVICTLLKIYDSNKNLILLVNATPEEESAIGEELGIMGCRRPGLRVVGHETPGKDRQKLYNQGGLISVTSRILIVDMLQGDIPVNLITGMLILHAEKVTPLVSEAFIVRLYREKNRNGFIKAFTDQAEHITSGMSPLKNVMKELQLRRVHLFPRFHEHINKSLERRRADVVELSQPLSDSMSDIHHAIIQCMSTTLSELKRSNTNLDLDDLNVENAYFRSFDAIVRYQLASVWHQVGPKTKQLINDLKVLRQLLFYLLQYDAISFYMYLETIIESNTTSSITGGPKVHQSPWLLTDAANIIFEVAKRRCFVISKGTLTTNSATMIDVDGEDDAWEALDELYGGGKGHKGKEIDPEKPNWLPKSIEPILEEQPKWDLLSDILLEIEQETIRFSDPQQQQHIKDGGSSYRGSDTVLIMTSSTRSCSLIQGFLDRMDPDAESGKKGRAMMMSRLRGYLAWRGKLGGASPSRVKSRSGQGTAARASSWKGKEKEGSEYVSEALRKKDKERAEKSASRRRVRGGAPSVGARGQTSSNSGTIGEVEDVIDVNAMSLWTEDTLEQTAALTALNGAIDLDLLTQDEFESSYGLLPSEQTVIVRAYSDDTDDRMLAEIQPRFIVMFEPSVEFVRRVEVYRSSYAGLAVRVYHMVYANSCEEHRYLAAIRKEKEAFERLVKERGSMLLTIEERREPGSTGSEGVIKTISTRVAGGRRELNKEPSKVIVDMREFRSTLPSLLHAANILVIPATLTVGDYILTPDICVERKSLTDLVSSFNSGRLYTQAEFMSVHYKHPVLLIEFEEDKAFSLGVISSMKSYVKPTGRYPKKTGTAANSAGNAFNPSEDNEGSTAPTVQARLVLLTLTFPRLRIIWSSSPYATAEIFADLKVNQSEPDPIKAIMTGADGDPDVGKGVNAAAEELLKALPGIGSGGGGGSSVASAVMRKCKSVRELCELSEESVKELVGVGPGKILYEFLHKGE